MPMRALIANGSHPIILSCHLIILGCHPTAPHEKITGYATIQRPFYLVLLKKLMSGGVWRQNLPSVVNCTFFVPTQVAFGTAHL